MMTIAQFLPLKYPGLFKYSHSKLLLMVVILVAAIFNELKEFPYELTSVEVAFWLPISYVLSSLIIYGIKKVRLRKRNE